MTALRVPVQLTTKPTARTPPEPAPAPAKITDQAEIAPAVLARTDTEDGVLVTVKLPSAIADRYGRYAVNGSEPAS